MSAIGGLVDRSAIVTLVCAADKLHTAAGSDLARFALFDHHRQIDSIENALHFIRAAIAALGNGARSRLAALIDDQGCATAIHAEWNAIDRGAARQERVCPTRSAVVLQEAEQWIGVGEIGRRREGCARAAVGEVVA